MNNPPIPPPIPGPQPPQVETHPGPTAVPFPSGFLGTLEGILKNPSSLFQSFLQRERSSLALHLFLIVVGCMAAFGLVLASFSGHDQWVWAPVKISVGLLLSGLLCLPSLYVFGCLSGLSIRPGAAAAMLLAMLSLCSLIIIGFAPVAWIFAQSTDSVAFVGTIALMMWVIALWFAFGLLKQVVRLLGIRVTEHIRVWMLMFTIVTLQMTTTLRPILGTSDTVLPKERKFFPEHWWNVLQKQAEVSLPGHTTPGGR
jgi:hypothetical protein